jgi:hypothetical protein
MNMNKDDPDEDLQDLGGTKGCSFCGGLGHRITECPKLEKDARRIGAGKKDSLAGNDGYGGICIRTYNTYLLILYKSLISTFSCIVFLLIIT